MAEPSTTFVGPAGLVPDEEIPLLALTAVASTDRDGKYQYHFRVEAANTPSALSIGVLELFKNWLCEHGTS